MKKILLTLVFAFALNTLSAQSELAKNKSTDFNQWSIELSGGFNKPQNPLTPGYFTSTISPFTVELGTRYMFNNKFGLKADFGYVSITRDNKSKDFGSKYYRVDLQGVANLGRIMNFETWTKTIGLLGHAGFGVAQLNDNNSSLTDKMGNIIFGFTGQIKLTNKIALTGDMTTILNARQDYAFDFASQTNEKGFNGKTLFTGTVGLTFYLGKNEKHADWVIENDDRFAEINARFVAVENRMLDTDNDGVANYLDKETDTPAGAMVDTKGRSIDKNHNGVPDETEAYFLKNYTSKTDNTQVLTSNEQIKNTINSGYVCTYFDFNVSKPNNTSTEGIAFILTYLRSNPTASVDVIGHADEIGKSSYNDKLSNARATNVKNILLKANINPSRINVIASGEDNSVDKNSDSARKLVRRVTFMIK